MIRAALAATTTICVLLLPAVAGADPTDRFSASITPAAVQPAAVNGTYTIFVANQPSSSPAMQGTIDIPTGFVLDVATAPTASIVSGPCSGHIWNVTPTLAQLALAAPDDGSVLCGRGTLAVSFSVQSAPLVDGPYTWTTSLSASSGLPFLAMAQPTLVIDGTAPETTITGSPSSPSAPSISFSFSGSDGTGSGVGGYQCSLDGGAFSACTSPKSYSGLLDGSHHFEVRAVDAAGNADPVAASFDWTVDAVAPETTVDVAPPSLTSSRSAQLSFHGTDSGSGVAGYECSLDGAAYASCANPVSYSGLADGPHSFGVRAIDNVGNVDASPATASWTVDATPPGPPLISTAPSDPSADTMPTFAFTDSDATAVFQCRVDGGAFAACPGSFTPAAALGDGAHTFGVKAIDPALNESTVTTRSWTVDSIAPQTTIDAHPPSLTSSRSAQLSFHGTDSGSGVAGYECSLDGAAYASCANPVSYSGLADGPHSFGVRAIDNAGNASVATASWTVDATPPAPPLIGSAPPDPSADTMPTFAFTDSDATAVFRCQVDGGAFAACPGSFTPAAALVDGVHTFGVKAIDPALNESTLTTHSWTVDTVHPLVSIAQTPPLLTNQTEAQFTFAANKPGSSYHCALDGGTFASCGSPTLYSGLGDGSHTFAVYATWLVLDGPVTRYTWTVDTVPPQTTIASGPPASSQTTSATFTFASSEAASTFTCRLDGAGLVPCTSPMTYTGLGDGDHTFSVQAADAAGNADATAATYAWQISGVGPPKQDLRPPANVSNVRRSVGYGRLQLHWRNPSDSDFDHVAVFVATKRSTPPRTLVFSGRSQTYSNRRFKNGLYYRYLIVSYDHAENAAGGTPVTVPPNVLLKGAGEGRIVHAPPLLRWTAVRKATFYNVQIFHRGRKILSAWPAKARQKLGRRWAYGGRHFTLRAGIYSWYVWPAFGPRAKSRYGQLLGVGTFKVR
jgi:large repetitive protein